MQKNQERKRCGALDLNVTGRTSWSFWLKPFLAQNPLCLCKWRCCGFFSFSTRLLMPRGWNRAPDGWWQRSLRGPRHGRASTPPLGWTTCEVSRRSGFRSYFGEDGSRSRVAARPGTAEGSRSAHTASPVERAQSKVKRFEVTLKAVGDLQGPEVDSCRKRGRGLDNQRRSAHSPARCPSAEGSWKVQSVVWR